jgi:hypothetical protein
MKDSEVFGWVDSKDLDDPEGHLLKIFLAKNSESYNKIVDENRKRKAKLNGNATKKKKVDHPPKQPTSSAPERRENPLSHISKPVENPLSHIAKPVTRRYNVEN